MSKRNRVNTAFADENFAPVTLLNEDGVRVRFEGFKVTGEKVNLKLSVNADYVSVRVDYLKVDGDTVLKNRQVIADGEDSGLLNVPGVDFEMYYDVEFTVSVKYPEGNTGHSPCVHVRVDYTEGTIETRLDGAADEPEQEDTALSEEDADETSEPWCYAVEDEPEQEDAALSEEDTDETSEPWCYAVDDEPEQEDAALSEEDSDETFEPWSYAAADEPEREDDGLIPAFPGEGIAFCLPEDTVLTEGGKQTAELNAGEYINNYGDEACSLSADAGTEPIDESQEECPKEYDHVEGISAVTAFVPTKGEFDLGGATVVEPGKFAGNISLKHIVIPEGVTEIGDRAFADCAALETVVLPRSLRKIGTAAFAGCKALKRVEIPEGVEEICDFAFGKTESLKEVHLPDSLQKAASTMFGGGMFCEPEVDVCMSGELALRLFRGSGMPMLAGRFIIDGAAYDSLYDYYSKAGAEKTAEASRSEFDSYRRKMEKAVSEGEPLEEMIEAGRIDSARHFATDKFEFAVSNLDRDAEVTLSGKRFVLTGFGYYEDFVREEIEKRGGTVHGSMVKKADYLVVYLSDPGEAKVKAALQWREKGASNLIVSDYQLWQAMLAAECAQSDDECEAEESLADSVSAGLNDWNNADDEAEESPVNSGSFGLDDRDDEDADDGDDAKEEEKPAAQNLFGTDDWDDEDADEDADKDGGEAEEKPVNNGLFGLDDWDDEDSGDDADEDADDDADEDADEDGGEAEEKPVNNGLFGLDDWDDDDADEDADKDGGEAEEKPVNKGLFGLDDWDDHDDNAPAPARQTPVAPSGRYGGTAPAGRTLNTPAARYGGTAQVRHTLSITDDEDDDEGTARGRSASKAIKIVLIVSVLLALAFAAFMLLTKGVIKLP